MYRIGTRSMVYGFIPKRYCVYILILGLFCSDVLAESDTFILTAGRVDAIWGGDSALSFFDELNGYEDCTDEQAGTEDCHSVDWSVTEDGLRGKVLEVEYGSNAGHAGLVVGPSSPVDLSGYSAGSLSFDIRLLNPGAVNQILIKVESGMALSGELPLKGIDVESSDWQSVSISVSELTASGALQMDGITAPMVFFPAYRSGANLKYRIDNVRFTGFDEFPETPTNSVEYNLLEFGAGNVADRINPSSYRCVFDYGNWIYNAGVVKPGIAGCETSTSTPSGIPTALAPQTTGPASLKPTATHRWWGSISFLGEMRIGYPSEAA